MQQQLLGRLPELVNNVAGNILSYALILAAVATITMTFLEVFKTLFKLRFTFNKKMVNYWLKDAGSFKELLILTITTSDEDDQAALFDQPIDKMMAQVQAAVNVAVDFPDTYTKLYHFFTDIPIGSEDERSDAQVWQEFITRSDSISNPDPTDPAVQRATRARARIDHFVARKLDAFQTRSSYQWARKNQYYSVFASALFLVGLLIYINVPIVWAVLLAIFGGMMAPFAKDIVSSLSGLKTK
jgi:hypothetical protein